jgi:nucleotide-binding universal stress UspA family protein
MGESETLDVLVTGSRGYGAVRAVLLGSVSRALVRGAACPVVVSPRPGRTNTDS